ncbi:hypothetical protein [Ornithobacterium rhinotracheale]|uniref:Uncharacterized protein n=1 Tax=Ornithobacterium rhinotracheale (strain ATCC 51463 / DSM 15997 / CCUG 23171 / CIP 104009 / LMG 9086) TaxID=867902 RepID=I4A1G2_ORNRL|nr:hypothetical protein [Ornithobacterium rhinotracheale]AFL97796.1 hypothetical protein Ornrh_1639 [Ornithobacterium rhinotracheale DSM 15997]AIP99627.1 hypothetical protein Q785_08030 [Ornithobacterium rhinotracheale ORT-UMN 88]KGB66412.1 hypothetical protein Q787_07860 [Ornithobacterium rhinotracheale H06-030791]MBN3661490.1 hypothetical protein [Ornithobacterium rhinotracheale]MCK0193908.1 hypothetical protein [Ornithobacterium rhinotracheale]
MKQIIIQADAFFNLLKEREQSMWEVFSQLIKNGEKQELIFLNDKKEVLFAYILPETLEELRKDQKVFAQEFMQKLKQMEN